MWTAEGNVVPWLLACSMLIHNGCTTAVEGYILKRPVIAYVPLAGGDDFAIDPPNSVSDRRHDRAGGDRKDRQCARPKTVRDQ